MTEEVTGEALDREVRERWRLTAGPCLGSRLTSTWQATRDGVPFVVKHFGDVALPDWPYVLRVMGALRRLG